MKKILFLLPAAALLLVFFCRPAAVAYGCSLGLKLWYTAVLPSLLPFLIISGLLLRTGLFRYFTPVCAPVLGRLYRISDEGCYALLTGFFCGFPMGAKTAADLVGQGQIPPAEGEYLLGFCNNVSPAFFLNYVCLVSLRYPAVPWKLAGAFYALPLLYGLLTRPFFHFPARRQDAHKKQAALHRLDFPMLDACIMDSFATITRLGGYIILFAILVQLLRTFSLPTPALAFLSALLELNCGISALAALPGLTPLWRIALICAAAAFGGLCVCAQTKSVLSGTPLRLKGWLVGRVFTAAAAFLLVFLPAAVPALRGCW